MKAPVVIVLGPGGVATGQAIAAALPGAALHGFAPRVPEAAVTFADPIQHLRALFTTDTPIVAVCAAGIVIRALAPVLADKTIEPPVVAVAEDGSAAVPLLGGHRGANELARRIARALGGVAAVTTAGDLRLGLALDEPPPGWRLAPGSAVKEVTAALLADQAVALEIETAAADCDWLKAAPFRDGGRWRVVVTDRAVAAARDTVVLHPPTLALGLGSERGAQSSEVSALVRSVLDESGLSPLSIACVVSLDLKAAEPAIHAVAKERGVPARFFAAERLKTETPRLANPSQEVFRETGCYGVAEGAALAAAGSEATLVVPKRRSRRATAALARSPRPIEATAVGRARGSLAIVGIGPGHAAGRTAEAEAALRGAGDWVGYRLYLDLLAGLAAGKVLHGYELGEERERVGTALDLAASGKDVALVGSGDAGIYAMAALVFEEIERSGNAAWARVEITGVAGISAMQTAAARVGAPLGHDFCAISLSDLLTPWSTIERRLKAAAEGDFVVAFYNPRSARRRQQLTAACRILLGARGPETPVVIARNLGRAGESIEVTTLSALDAAAVDMLSVVLVGSSATRTLARPDGGVCVYTPRGYAAKDEPAP